VTAAPAYAGGVDLVEVVRSGFVESRHRGSVAILDASGRLVASAGDPSGAVFPRSSNKPMQAVALLRAGLRLAGPADLTDPADLADLADLAMVGASHHGEPFHVARVAAMLASGGLTEQALRCPPDLPLSEPARLAVLRSGGGPRPITMNCSGKHAGMLLTCLAAGWPLDDYRAVGHPVQEACRVAIEELCGERVAATGVDGCGAAVFALSLAGLARGVLGVVTADPGTPERAVADAMRAHPELVSGTDGVDARLMRAVPGLLCKGGAEGVMVAALPGTGAVALKIDDGSARATAPAMVAALARLGIGDAGLTASVTAALLGGGVPVGVIRAAQ
jgi:L-asparaginase II